MFHYLLKVLNIKSYENKLHHNHPVSADSREHDLFPWKKSKQARRILLKIYFPGSNGNCTSCE